MQRHRQVNTSFYQTNQVAASHLHCDVEWLIELHRGGRVHHDLRSLPQHLGVLQAKPKPRRSDIPRHRRQLCSHKRSKRLLSNLSPQPIKDGAADNNKSAALTSKTPLKMHNPPPVHHLLVQTHSRLNALARTDEQHNLPLNTNQTT